MSEPIKVGDLVVVVRDCCGDNLGVTFVVEEIFGPRTWECSACKHVGWATTIAYRQGARDGLLCHAPLFWLKRIPPLAELEGEDRREEITA